MSTWLLTWNADRWQWRNLTATVRKVRAGRPHTERWSCAQTRAIKKGDRLFMLKQGNDPRGIFASGWAKADAYRDAHWDENAPSHTTMYVDLEFDALLDPRTEPMLPRKALDDGILGTVHWNTQSSGIRIHDRAATILERVWGSVLAKDEYQSSGSTANKTSGNRAGGQGGGGFGTPETNAKVESAAIHSVMRFYERGGWIVESVERDRCGFDLRCRRGTEAHDVEVKGNSGSDLGFIITSGEVTQANENPRFMLCVVTSALSRRPRIATFTGPEFLRRFVLVPIQYRASPNVARLGVQERDAVDSDQ